MSLFQFQSAAVSPQRCRRSAQGPFRLTCGPLSASALHLFKNDSNRIGLAVAIAALVPIIVFSLWFAASAGFRQFALSLDPRILTSAQAWRIIGFTFVLLEARGILPAKFAWPAGYGDMAIGMTARFVGLEACRARSSQ